MPKLGNVKKDELGRVQVAARNNSDSKKKEKTNLEDHESDLNRRLSKFSSIFLVMDYVETDLDSVMRSVKNGTNLTEKHVITLAYNMLCGVNVLHRCGLIHRDLKPNNILVGDSCRVKICDFGMSRKLPVRSPKEGTSIISPEVKQAIFKTETKQEAINYTLGKLTEY